MDTIYSKTKPEGEGWVKIPTFTGRCFEGTQINHGMMKFAEDDFDDRRLKWLQHKWRWETGRLQKSCQ